MQDHASCLQLIEHASQDTGSQSAYFLEFNRAMVLRQQGRLKESFAALESAVRLDPHNSRNMRHVAHGLSLLGRHSAAVSVYDEAIALEPEDWELYHTRAVCHRQLNNLVGCGSCTHGTARF